MELERIHPLHAKPIREEGKLIYERKWGRIYLTLSITASEIIVCAGLTKLTLTTKLSLTQRSSCLLTIRIGSRMKQTRLRVKPGRIPRSAQRLSWRNPSPNVTPPMVVKIWSLVETCSRYSPMYSQNVPATSVHTKEPKGP